MGYSPWGHKELDTTEHLILSTFTISHTLCCACVMRTLKIRPQHISSIQYNSVNYIVTILYIRSPWFFSSSITDTLNTLTNITPFPH